MNVYEEAHKLAQAVRESEEYKQFVALQKQVDADPTLSAQVKSFQEKQIQMQKEELGKGNFNSVEDVMRNMTPAMQESMQELSRMMMSSPILSQYLQAQMRFTIMMNDVYKILGDVMGIGNLSLNMV